MINLSNKNALITGAGGAIGGAVVKKLFQLGAQVALLDIAEESIKNLAKDLDKDLKKALYFACDVRDEKSLIEVKSKILEKWKKIDILVNCVGAEAAAAKTEELSFEEWRKILSADLDGSFLTCKTFGSVMIANKYGRIVNFTSFHTIATYPNRAAYNAAKSGVEGLTRALAVEWGCYGITVNAVAPGPIRTPRTSWFLSKSPDIESGMIGRTPNTRLGETEDIAALVAFLASDEARHINGQQIVIDGGWTKCAWWGKHEKKY
jgi:NAD(P)-dependent dehydrogenase (short-subunit alcohol dehydrogenase family)